MDITALVPCHNEEATIEGVLKTLLTSPHLHCVVVVDDASSDQSRQIIKKLAKAHNRLKTDSSRK